MYTIVTFTPTYSLNRGAHQGGRRKSTPCHSRTFYYSTNVLRIRLTLQVQVMESVPPGENPLLLYGQPPKDKSTLLNRSWVVPFLESKSVENLHLLLVVTSAYRLFWATTTSEYQEVVEVTRYSFEMVSVFPGWVTFKSIFGSDVAGTRNRRKILRLILAHCVANGGNCIKSEQFLGPYIIDNLLLVCSFFRHFLWCHCRHSVILNK